MCSVTVPSITVRSVTVHASSLRPVTVRPVTVHAFSLRPVTVAAIAVASLIAVCRAGALPAEERVLRSWDISFLTAEVPQFPAREWPTAGSLIAGSAHYGPYGAYGDYGGGALVFGLGDEGDALPEGARVAPDALVELIRRNIAEDSWASTLNSIEANERELVVRNVPSVHAAVEALLASLRARRARMFRLDVALVPAEAVGERDPEREPSLEAEAFDRIVAAAGERGSRLGLIAYNEQTVSGSTGKLRAARTDDEVNQTGVLPVVNPVVESLPIGVTVEATPFAIPGTDWLELELRVARLREAGEARTLPTFFGEIESVPLHEDSLETTLLLASGRTAVAGVFEATRLDGKREEFAVIVRARRTDLDGGRAAPPPVAETFHLRIHDLGTALLGGAGEPAVLDEETVETLIRTNVDPEAWKDERASLSVGAGRFLHVVARDETHEAVRAWAGGLIRKACRIALVRAEVLEAPASAALGIARLAGSSGLLPEGWREGDAGRALRARLRLVAQGKLARRIRARAFDARSYLADVNAVSGGTGFSIMEVPDPEVRSAGTGFELEARARPLLDPGRHELELRLDEARTELSRSAVVLLPAQLGSGIPAAAPSGSAAETGPLVMRRISVPLPYRVELPDWTALRCAASVVLPAERDVLVRIAEGEPGRAVLVVARVRVLPAFGEPAEGGPVPPVPAMQPVQPVRPVQPVQPAREARVLDVGRIAAEPMQPPREHPGAPAVRGEGLGGYDPEWEAVSFSFDGAGGFEDPSPGSLRLTPEMLEQAIKRLVAPDSWSNARNSVVWRGDREEARSSLVVVQTRDVIDRIDALLRRLQERASRTVTLDIALVPPEALAEAAPGWRRPGSPPWLPPDALDRAVRASRGRALVASGPVPEGTRRSFGPGRASARLVDMEINCTGVLPVRNPVIGACLEGSFAEALVLRSPSGGWFRVDLIVGRTAPLGEPERRKTELGPIELIAERQARLETTVLAPAGATVLAGVFAASGKAEGGDDPAAPESFAALVRVTPPEPARGEAGGEGGGGADGRAEGKADGRTGGRPDGRSDGTPDGRPYGRSDAPGVAPAVVEAGLLLEPLPRYHVEPSRDPRRGWQRPIAFDPGGDGGDAPLLAPAALDSLLETVLPESARPEASPERGRRWRHGGTILLEAEGPAVAALRRGLDELGRERAVLVVVDLWQGVVEEAELEALGSGGAILDASWLARMERDAESRVRTTSLAGRNAALASVASRNYIGDIEMVTGGTTYTVLEVGDPMVYQVGEGLVLNATASLVPGTDWAQLRVEGETARRPDIRRKTTARQSGGVKLREGAPPGEEAEPTGELLELDLPEEDADRWQHFVTVPLGRPVFLSALPDAARPGKSRVLLGTVHAFRIEGP